MIHQEFGRKILERFIEGLQDIAKTEKDPVMEGGQLVVFFVKK